MKNSIFYILAVLSITASCKDQPKDLNPENKIDDISSKNEPIDLVDCYHKKLIPRDGALIWENSWTFSAEHTIGFKPDIQKKPEFIFSKENLERMMPSDTVNKGAFFYYILENPVETDKGTALDRIPSLLMIKTDACNLSGDDGLISWYNQDSPDTFEHVQDIYTREYIDYRKNWKEYIKSANNETVPVKGYFYSWDFIYRLLQKNQSALIRYGVRTLGPDEIEEFGGAGNVTGSENSKYGVGVPVLCNIIAGYTQPDPPSPLNTDAAFADMEVYDFAKPCPALCPE